MGRNTGKRGRTQRRDFRDSRENVWKKSRAVPQQAEDADANGRNGWAPFVMESPAFEMYYKNQRIVPEDEWEQFIATLRKPLPTTFRINGSGQFAQNIRDQMQRDFFDYLKDETEIDGEVIEPVRPLPWYPDNLAWHLGFSRMQLRKIPILERIHEFLKQENEVGSITRQEEVSMVPPLFLGVQSHHRVLDMCAAPGSKTFQLLEIIHSKDERAVLPKGMVIANDLDVQRCHLLIHQTKRMCSPNILVTNHEAQHFPGLKSKISEADLKDAEATEGGENGLSFDCILCDVPCSGDGTIRKAPDIWKRWNSGNGNGLHRLQIQIAMRGVALLNVGGRMVYSTCSLNPVEDEAVVGEILRQSEGSLELLDVSSELPGLTRRPGLTTWKVQGRKRWFSCYSSYWEQDKYRAGTVLPSMFPSGKRVVQINLEAEEKEANQDQIEEVAEPDLLEENAADTCEAEGEVADLPLERCMRILPHDQDTGGFFIAVFRKVRPYKSVPKKKDIIELQVPRIVDPDEPLANILGASDKGMSEVLQTSKEKVDCVSSKEEAENLEMVGREVVDEAEKGYISSKVEKAENGEVEKAENGELLSKVDDVGELVRSKLCADDEAEPTELAIPKQQGRCQRQGPWRGVDPVMFLKDEDIISSLVSYYGIQETLPLRGHLIVRSEDTSRVKRIYYVSKSVSAVVQLNFQAGQMLKITSAGLKIFERHSNKELSPCAFRIASEGLPLLLPHITKQILYSSKEDFKLLLSPKPVPFTAFRDPEFASAVRNLLLGCCVVLLKDNAGTEDAPNSSVPTAVGCWRGRSNVSLLVPRAEADQMLQRLFPSDVSETKEEAIPEQLPANTGAVECENSK